MPDAARRPFVAILASGDFSDPGLLHRDLDRARQRWGDMWLFLVAGSPVYGPALQWLEEHGLAVAVDPPGAYYNAALAADIVVAYYGDTLEVPGPGRRGSAGGGEDGLRAAGAAYYVIPGPAEPRASPTRWFRPAPPPSGASGR